MPFTRSNERVFNRAVVAMAPQTASGSPISDFSSGTGAAVWAREVRANENQQFESFQGVHGDIQERTQGFFNTVKLPEFEVTFYPTPLIITEMLKSFGGALSGTTVTWPLGIETFYSFLIAEAEDGNASARAYRFEDGWVRELEFNVGGFGVAVCTARVIAQNVTEFAASATGLTYPSKPPDFVQYAHRASDFIREPSGANVQLAFKEARINLRHGFNHEAFNDDFGRITKQGFLEVTGTITTRPMDETIIPRQDALAATLRAYRLRLVNGTDELRFDFNNAFFSPSDVGFANRDVLDMVLNFRSGTTDPDAQDAVTINILP